MILPNYRTTRIKGFLAMWKWIRDGLSKDEWESLYLDQAANEFLDGDNHTNTGVRHTNTSVEKIEQTKKEAEKKQKKWRWN